MTFLFFPRLKEILQVQRFPFFYLYFLFLYLFFKHSSRIKTQLFTTLTGREVTVDLSRFITVWTFPCGVEL